MQLQAALSWSTRSVPVVVRCSSEFYKKDGLGLGLGRALSSPDEPSRAHTRSARISSPSFPDDGGGGRSSRGA